MKKLGLMAIGILVLVGACKSSSAPAVIAPVDFNIEGRFFADGAFNMDGCGLLGATGPGPVEGIEFTDQGGGLWILFNGCINQSGTRSGNTLIFDTSFSDVIQGCTLTVDIHTVYNFVNDNRYTGSQVIDGTADCGTGPLNCQTTIDLFGDRDAAAVVACAATSESMLRRVWESMVDKQVLEAPHR